MISTGNVNNSIIEYLAPEFIFNLGHDSSSDLWALGVLIYEMFMTATPFAPKKQDNVTELFTNIATVKVNRTF
jgi:serine/threonine protein kinase